MALMLETSPAPSHVGGGAVGEEVGTRQSDPVLYINGRFLVQRQTGVQRFAMEVVRAIDALLDEDCRAWQGDVRLITPRGVSAPPRLRNVRHLAAGIMGGGYAWEQFDLPRLTMDGILLNLCNLGPIAKRRQVVVLHDASTRAQPHAFSRTFRTAYAILIPAICRRASQLATVSQFSRAELSRWFGASEARLTVCYEGAEHILELPADATVIDSHDLQQRRYFLAVGMGAANKNLDVLLRAFDRANLPGVYLVLTGRRSAQVHRALAVDMPPKVIQVGHIPDQQLRALYENAIALTYPSAYEGFGLPPLEAMACGCPVIISNQDALIEISGKAAQVVERNNVEALAEGLAKVAGDHAYRAHLARIGSEHVGQFTWRRTAETLLAQCQVV
jgi:glycosyltransferase involved in cell wall biosynthesis